MTTFVIDRQHQSRNAAELTCEARVPVNTKATSGLVLHLAANGNDMRRACRAKGILHTLGYAGIVAQQDAGEE